MSIIKWFLTLLLSCSHIIMAFGWICHANSVGRRRMVLETVTSCSNLRAKTWDDLEDEEASSVKPDMKYVPRNVMRQNQNFIAIREAGGKELTNDVYVPEPRTETFWFVGKVARISDVSAEEAVARQWNLITTHAANLRPIELFPARSELEVWIAPGDSEMEVGYNRPDIRFLKASRDIHDVDKLKSSLMGFQGEMYEGNEEGFRTLRKKDGLASRPEVQSPCEDEARAPTEDEMLKIQKELEGKDINEVYEEQQRRYRDE